MDKRIKKLASATTLSDFIGKISAKWQLGTQPNTPSRVEDGESTESILADLIAIPSTTGNYQANKEGLDYIETFLRRHNMHLKRFEWNGVESLVATTRKTKTPTVFLMAHFDVVTAPPELFNLRLEDGKYYGRGVLDMKAALAAYLGVVQELGDSLPEYDFGIMVVTDEEIGGFDGASRLADAGYIPKVVVIPDGGTNDWNIERLAKGIWWITIEATGIGAHGSRPWEGKNAIDTIIAASHDIRNIFTDVGPDADSISLGAIRGGKTINQIPTKATASFDMRFASPEAQAHTHAEIDKIAKRYNLQVTTEVESLPVVNDINNPYALAYKTCTEEVIGHPVKWVVSNAGNDARWLAARGSAVASAYPVGGKHHANDEWIAQESLLQMQKIFLKYLRKVAYNKQ